MATDTPITDEFPALPAELTIYAAAETHQQWLAWWQQHGAMAPIVVEADAAAVDSVDAAGLQLLVSLSHLLQREERTLRLLQPSAVMRAACTTLGLGALLGPGATA